MLNRLSVLGAGSWGTALGLALSSKFNSVAIWSHNRGRAAEMQEKRENRRYLPGFSFPANLYVSCDAREVLAEASIVLTVVPSQALRTTLREIQPHFKPGTPIVSATKGIESETLKRMSEVIAETLQVGLKEVAVLSGPTFAKEVAAGEPAAVVIASENFSLAEEIQRAFSTPRLRFYASHDPTGVELGAALKNVIAIGAGICSGLGLGSNSVAALVTRGLAEITRLAVILGGNPRTLSGLAGLGDLVLTATGDLSRNRHVGVQLGQNHSLDTILQTMNMVAEGVATCRAARDLGLREGADLPIIQEMYQVLYQAKDPRIAIRDLMERPLKIE